MQILFVFLRRLALQALVGLAAFGKRKLAAFVLLLFFLHHDALLLAAQRVWAARGMDAPALGVLSLTLLFVSAALYFWDAERLFRNRLKAQA